MALEALGATIFLGLMLLLVLRLIADRLWPKAAAPADQPDHDGGLADALADARHAMGEARLAMEEEQALTRSFLLRHYEIPARPDGKHEERAERIEAPRQPAPETATHRLEYADAFGEVSERDVHVWRIVEDAGKTLYIESFCFLRMAPRTFRADRVQSLRELPGGRIICDPRAYFDAWPGKSFSLRGPAAPRLASTPDHEWVMARSRAGLRGLIWLAAADRRIAPEEEEVMLKWVGLRAQAGNSPGRPWNRSAALAWIRAERVTFDEASGGLTRMRKAEAARFVEIMEDLMLADGEKCRLEESRARRLAALLPAR